MMYLFCPAQILMQAEDRVHRCADARKLGSNEALVYGIGLHLRLFYL
jgi:hypothetical protein